MTLTALLLVYAMAVARVTRIINQDVLLDDPRERVVSWAWRRRYGTVAAEARENDAVEPKLAYLITCPWCASIYVGALAAPLWFWWGTSPFLLVPAAALAFSYVTGYLAQHGE